jgi:hypothetical protein
MPHSQSMVSCSSSVHAGEAIQSKPITFRPAHKVSPSTAGYELCGLKYLPPPSPPTPQAAQPSQGPRARNRPRSDARVPATIDVRS